MICEKYNVTKEDIIGIINNYDFKNEIPAKKYDLVYETFDF